jgi:hypothetical protein
MTLAMQSCSYAEAQELKGVCAPLCSPLLLSYSPRRRVAASIFLDELDASIHGWIAHPRYQELTRGGAATRRIGGMDDIESAHSESCRRLQFAV